MNNISDGFQPWFDWEAKVVNDEMFRTSWLMELCSQYHIEPRSLTEDKLIEIWVARDKLAIIRPIIAKKILEYYGMQWREMKNAKRVDESWITQEHYDFITRSLSIEWCFAKFLRSNCWDRVDNNWEWTQYDAMVQQFPTPENASQKVIIVKPEEVNKVLVKRFQKDLERIVKEMADPKTTTERKEALEKSQTILEHKLKELDDENNAQGDWWSK